MANLKHIGRIANTGVKCVVVFRELYDERGNVTDPNHCLVVETERLPDMEHDDVVRIVEGELAQSSTEFYEVANRSLFSDGSNMLRELHKRGRLKKYPTDQIELTPNNSTAVKLSEVNKIIAKQKTGMSESDIKRVLEDDTDKPPREVSTTSFQPSPSQTIDQAVEVPGEQVLDDTAIAQGMLSQADTFLAEAKRLQEEAYSMAPSLKPKKGRTTKKATANANT